MVSAKKFSKLISLTLLKHIWDWWLGKLLYSDNDKTGHDAETEKEFLLLPDYLSVHLFLCTEVYSFLTFTLMPISPGSCHAHFFIEQLSTCVHNLQLPRGAPLPAGSVLLCHAVPRINKCFKPNICSLHYGYLCKTMRLKFTGEIVKKQTGEHLHCSKRSV